MYCCLYKPDHISDDEVINKAVSFSIIDEKNRVHHPEMHHVLKKSKYRGVKFDENKGIWRVEGTKQEFTTEKEAAQQAYIERESIPTTDVTEVRFETEEEKLRRRKLQLIAFYSFWDPEKDDIEAHVNNLFNKHEFRVIVRAVRAKFSLVPPGWDEEVAAEDV